MFDDTWVGLFTRYFAIFCLKLLATALGGRRRVLGRKFQHFDDALLERRHTIFTTFDSSWFQSIARTCNWVSDNVWPFSHDEWTDRKSFFHTDEFIELEPLLNVDLARMLCEQNTCHYQRSPQFQYDAWLVANAPLFLSSHLHTQIFLSFFLSEAAGKIG